MTDRPNSRTRTGSALSISNIELRFVENGRDGLVAWVSCVVGESIALHNIALRRGTGGLFLTYPAKQTGSGARFHYFNPINRAAGEALEKAVVRAVTDLLGNATPFVGETRES